MKQRSAGYTVLGIAAIGRSEVQRLIEAIERHDCSMRIEIAHPLAIAVKRPALSEALRERTASLHTEAERSGIISDILKRKADRRRLCDAVAQHPAGL